MPNFSPEIIIAIIAVTIAVLIGTYFIWQTTSEHAKPLDIFSEKPDMKSLENFDPLVDNSIRKQRPIDRTQGNTDRYKWTQNDQEIEIFVTVPTNVKGKDVLVDFLSTGIVLSVQGNIILDGDFCDEVIPGECNWQIGVLFNKLYA